LDTVKTRIQAAQEDESTASELTAAAKKQRGAKLRMVEILLRIIKQEGILGLFKGFAANMINTFSMRMSLLKTAIDGVQNLPISSSTPSSEPQLSNGPLSPRNPANHFQHPQNSHSGP
jgi:hypothetical protein